MPPFKTLNSTLSTLRTNVGSFIKNIDSRRKSRVERLNKDIDVIVKREREYTKQLIEELIPVKIVWDEEALDRIMNMIPFHIEVINTVVPEIVQDEEEEEKLEDSI